VSFEYFFVYFLHTFLALTVFLSLGFGKNEDIITNQLQIFSFDSFSNNSVPYLMPLKTFLNNFFLFARTEMFLLSESCNLCSKEYITNLSSVSFITYIWVFYFSESLWTKARIICAVEALLCQFSLFSSFWKLFTYGRMLSKQVYLFYKKFYSF